MKSPVLILAEANDHPANAVKAELREILGTVAGHLETARDSLDPCALLASFQQAEAELRVRLSQWEAF